MARSPDWGMAVESEVAQLLRQLLAEHPKYRARWMAHTRRVTQMPHNVHYAGVSAVIADYLWDAGLRSENDVNLARRLRSRVRRALEGIGISVETLSWFIDAFEMEPTDSNGLWVAMSRRPSEIISGSDVVAGTLAAPAPLLYPQDHRTITVFERLRLGPLGQSANRSTLQVIAARHAEVQAYHYLCFDTEGELSVAQGGQLVGRAPFAEFGTLHTVQLDRRLLGEDRLSLEVNFRYSAGASVADEFRRVVYGRTENVDICIEFDRQCIPQRAWWCHWNREAGGDVVHQEEIDVAQTLRRFVPVVEQSAIGFSWRW